MMEFNDKLKSAMQQLNITQKQLAGLTGFNKASVCQYVSGRNVPLPERQEKIAKALGLPADYFLEDTAPKIRPERIKRCAIPKLSPEDAATLMQVHHTTVRKGLQQGVFPWGYAIKTSEKQYTYFINAKRFFEIEEIEV